MKTIFYLAVLALITFSCGSNSSNNKAGVDSTDSSDISSGSDMLENGNITEQFALKLENIATESEVVNNAIALYTEMYAHVEISDKVEGFNTLNDYLIKHYSTLFDEKGISEKFKNYVTGIDSSAAIAQQYKNEVESLGVRLGHDEGYLYLMIDRDYLLNKMGSKCPDGLRQTLIISPLINKEIITDAAIILEPNEMVEYLMQLSSFINENASHPLLSDAKDKLKASLSYITKGVDNTPLLDDDGKITEYYAEMMKLLKAKHETSEVTKTIFAAWKEKGIKIKK